MCSLSEFNKRTNSNFSYDRTPHTPISLSLNNSQRDFYASVHTRKLLSFPPTSNTRLDPFVTNMSESKAGVRNFAEDRTQLKDDIAERHRISKARLEQARLNAVENRKKRRLSAPASLRGPGGKLVARRSSRLRTSFRAETLQGSDTETAPLREERP